MCVKCEEAAAELDAFFETLIERHPGESLEGHPVARDHHAAVAIITKGMKLTLALQREMQLEMFATMPFEGRTDN